MAPARLHNALPVDVHMTSTSSLLEPLVSDIFTCEHNYSLMFPVVPLPLFQPLPQQISLSHNPYTIGRMYQPWMSVYMCMCETEERENMNGDLGATSSNKTKTHLSPSQNAWHDSNNKHISFLLFGLSIRSISISPLLSWVYSVSGIGNLD